MNLENQLSSVFVGRRSEKSIFPGVHILCDTGWLNCLTDVVMIDTHELKIRIREVVQAVGFQSRGLGWYSYVQPGFCSLHVATLCSRQVSFLTMSLMQDGLGCCLSHVLLDLEFLGFFPPLQCMLPTRKALELLSAKSLCWLLSPVAMLILVTSLCEVCVSLGFSYFLATDLLRQYTGLKAKVMAAFPERVEIKENM